MNIWGIPVMRVTKDPCTLIQWYGNNTKKKFLKDVCFGINTDFILRNIKGFNLPGV